MVKNKGLVATAYEWDEKDVSSDDNDMTKVKVLMALIDDENVTVGKESARNDEWVKIFVKIAITDSSATEYDSADESLVCNTLFPLLEKLAGAELIFGPKTIKSILKSNSTFKPETLKWVTINEPSSAPTKDNKIFFSF
nr:hypothetical protein [Tanacetum cinerariifolium]